MAKDILVKRSQKVAFLDVGTESTPSFKRMRGFTSLSTSKNPKEYNRQYVDEDFERTDLVGIATSREFAFDQFKDDPVHAKMVSIIDGELIGDAALIDMLVVDMTGESPYSAVKRTFALIPGTEGDSFDAYTYGGSFKAAGESVKGTATIADGVTATFTPTETPAG